MAKELSDLESEIEEARDRLANTIDQLVYRANPKTIVGRQQTVVRAHFVDTETGEPRTDNIAKVAGGVVGALVLLLIIRKIAR